MDADSRRIAFFVPALNAGGAQRVVINLVNGLAVRGYDVDVLLSYRQGELLNELRTDVTVVDLNTPHVPILGIGASIPRLVRYLRDVSPSVVFSAMTYVNVVSIVARSLSSSDVELIATEHTTMGMKSHPKDRLVAGTAKLLYLLADEVVAVSEGVAESVRANTLLDDEDVSKVYNPVVTPALRAQARVPPDHPWLRNNDLDVVLSAGRLEPEKDYRTLVRSFARPKQERDDLRLVILGEGSERQAIQDHVKERGIDDSVSLPGFVSNPYQCMSAASVFVLSSKREGLPSVLIEALACGCPVVATDCPSGPREILADGEYGPLVAVGDDAGISDAIATVLADPPQSERLIRRAEDFSLETVLDEYVKLIERHASQSSDQAVHSDAQSSDS